MSTPAIRHKEFCARPPHTACGVHGADRAISKRKVAALREGCLSLQTIERVACWTFESCVGREALGSGHEYAGNDKHCEQQ